MIPALGPIKLVNLTTRDIDRFLPHKAQTLSTASVEDAFPSSVVPSAAPKPKTSSVATWPCCAKSPVVSRDVPPRRSPSPKPKAIQGYVVTGLLTGARAEELRALTWAHLDLDDHPPSIQVGGPSAAVGRPRRRSPAGPSSSPTDVSTLCVRSRRGTKPASGR